MNTVRTVVFVTSFVACAWLGFASPARASPAPGDLLVNINTATADELQRLPGVGPSKAELIVARRKARPFRTIEELVRVKGIGRKTLMRLRPMLTVTEPTRIAPATAPAMGHRTEGCACPEPAAAP